MLSRIGPSRKTSQLRQTAQQDFLAEPLMYNIDESIKNIALHLVTTRQFYDLMSNPTYLKADLEKWACNVDLTARINTKDGTRTWIKHFRTYQYERRVLEYATLVYQNSRSLGSISHFASEAIRSPSPSLESEAVLFRERLFRYQQQRLQLLDLEKRCEAQYYSTLRSKDVETLRIQNSMVEGQQQKLEHLYLLHKCQGECQKNLSETVFEATMIAFLDKMVEEEALKPQADSQDPLRCYSSAIDKVVNTYNFSPRYIRRHGHKILKNPPHVWVSNSPRLAEFSPRPRSILANVPRDRSISDQGQQITKFALTIIKSIDLSLFSANFQGFLGIQSRLHYLAASQAGCRNTLHEGSERTLKIFSDYLPPVELLHDNIYHLNILFAALKEQSPPEKLPAVERTRRLLLAIIAIQYGCIQESALLLTTMDHLLKELRVFLDCGLGVYSHTKTCSSFRVIKTISRETLVASYYLSNDAKLTSTAEIFRRTKLCEELGRFAHGCFVAATACTYRTVRFPSPMNQLKSEFQSLLNWKNTCDFCGGDIVLRPGDENSKSPFSVGMRDIRAGNSVSRSYATGVADNRNDVYPCFSTFLPTGAWMGEGVRPINWNDTYGPFFFYFAKIYHPNCKNNSTSEARYW